ncbi:class F sortase [Granulicoccus phenolivorans]|uniref:class F sortase n=1 Tax=Granulicoccus phenolivorans TaxID=266854 RepID=UPI00040AD05D|nr:class F sortase [Granulicoccus phenolivorans]
MSKVTKSRWLPAALIAVGVIVLVVLIVVGVSATRTQGGTSAGEPLRVNGQTSQPEESSGGESTVAPASQDPSAASTATPGDTCTTTDQPLTDPSTMYIDSMKEKSEVQSLGEEPDGTPKAPTGGEQTGWYNRSPDVGSKQGNVMMTIHTFSPKNGSNALGNRMYAPGALKSGDVFRITDDSGKQVCYKYSGNTKIWVASYDENSDVWHNPNGKPQLAILICWDYNQPKDDWDSRIVFYADYMPMGTK